MFLELGIHVYLNKLQFKQLGIHVYLNKQFPSKGRVIHFPLSSLKFFT
jgi:hypothetical protein